MVAALLAAALLAVNVPHHPAEQFAAIEKQTGGRMGVLALDTGSGQKVEHRPTERFPLCSTFKLLAVAAVLKKVDDGKEHLDRIIPYSEQDLLEYAPVTKKHVKEGKMKLGDLCVAALQVSDNTAANLILRTLGGPAGVTGYVRTLGDKITRLDRTEPTLNSAIPGDPRDTTTPAAICDDLRQLFTTDALSAASRRQLEEWIAGNKTGDDLIRSGVPKDWKVGDKTGRGANGSINDIAFLRPPGRAPIVLAIYSSGSSAPLEQRKAAIAEAARIVAKDFSPND
jgi:beta-lactamase class A